MSDPAISDSALSHAKDLVAQIRAGHPDFEDVAYEDLLTWQRETVSMWALNLESACYRYVPALIAEVERLREATPEPLWTGETRFIGSREDPVPDRSWFVGGFALDVPPGTKVAIYRVDSEATS